jgi:acyl-CoA thioesterase-1
MIASVFIPFLQHCSPVNTPQLALLAALIFGLVLPVAPVYANTSTIVVYGDSISAAYGMDQDQGWVSLLAEQLSENHPTASVVNASVSGETTGGGRVRLEKTLEAHNPDILILELGGNDGLRGYPIDKIEANLDAMTRQAREAGAEVLLVGMVLPPNYGRRYTSAFEGVFATIAERYELPFVPFLLDGVATSTSLIQGDGIHPRPEAQQMILDDILPTLTTLLD